MDSDAVGVLASLGLTRYQAVLEDAGFDTLSFLTTATLDDFTSVGVKLGHARALYAHLHPAPGQPTPIPAQPPAATSQLGAAATSQLTVQAASVSTASASATQALRPFHAPSGCVWLSLDPRINVWVAYPPDQTASIEAAFAAGQPSVTIAIPNVGSFHLEFGSMRQRNAQNQARRITRRALGIVDPRTSVFVEEEKDMSAHLQESHEHYVIKARREGRPATFFKLSEAALVHNTSLHDSYLQTLQRLQSSGTCIDESLAFHGTTAESIHEILQLGLVPGGIATSIETQIPKSIPPTAFFGSQRCGVYVCTHVEDALRYSNGGKYVEAGQSLYVVVLRVLAGRTKAIAAFSSTPVEPSEGHESHASPDGRELFLYEPSQCYPVAVWLVTAHHATSTPVQAFQPAAFLTPHPTAGIKLSRDEYKTLQPRAEGKPMEFESPASFTFKTIQQLLTRTKSEKHRSFEGNPFASFKLTSVISLLNAERYKAWESCSGDHVALAFHGSTAYACARIHDEGFRPSIAGSFGSGIYLTPVSSLAAVFSSDPYDFDPDTRLFALVCWIKCPQKPGQLSFNKQMRGAEEVQFKGLAFTVSKARLTKDPVTLCSFPNGLNEILVEDTNSILPAFMIEFRPTDFRDHVVVAPSDVTLSMPARIRSLLFEQNEEEEPHGSQYPDLLGSWRLNCSFSEPKQFVENPWRSRSDVSLTATELTSFNPTELRSTEFHLVFTKLSWSPCQKYSEACPAFVFSSCQSCENHRCYGRKRLGLRRNHETGAIELYTVAHWGKQFMSPNKDNKMIKPFGKPLRDGDLTGAATLLHWLLFFRADVSVIMMLISTGSGDTAGAASTTGILPLHIARSTCAIDAGVQLAAFPDGSPYTESMSTPPMSEKDCEELFGP
eukprot:m.113113 g.113113  ORF g.113113 m.113113 type:complete len:892 (+) comp51860_c0_seq2:78-2753(+)